MTPFGPQLRQWRRRRRMSQQALSEAAEVSTRHISCLENGRSAPSRQMVLLLASALDVPLRERNDLLAAAGFTPAYGAHDLSEPEMAPIRHALDFLFQRFEPNPALAVDRRWAIQGMNQGAARLAAWFLADATLPPGVMGNAMHLVFHPDGLRRFVVNWPEVAGVTLARLRRDAARDPDGAGQLLDELLAWPGVPEPAMTGGDGVLVPIHLRRRGVELRLATLLTTLGTPVDATAQELTVELYFPLDAATAAWLDQGLEGVAQRG
ncbi:MAG: helix-turn-helix domain-containing protein [Alphaproteobacteria bacterium]|nr:helix-turn-helix domain-containing protein [Alphaproteobacteria bacterium]